MKIRINGDLRGTPEVRVIASDGEMLGVMSLAKALRLAMKEGLDLVEVNPAVDPPVCKLLDFSKYTYAEKREAAEARRRETEDRSGIPEERPVAPEPAIVWTPFECDGRTFEYFAFPTKVGTRPAGWPAHKATPNRSAPHVMVIVRKAGDESDAGAGMVFPDGTVITTEHAIETARMFWETLTK